MNTPKTDIKQSKGQKRFVQFLELLPNGGSLRVIGHSPPLLLTKEQAAQQVGNDRQVLVHVVSCHWRKLDEICRRFMSPNTAREHICRYLCTYYDFLNLGQVTFVFPGNLTGNHFDSFLQARSREYTKIQHKVLGF